MAAGARGQTLGDVLGVGGGASLTGTSAERKQRQCLATLSGKPHKKQGFISFTADGAVGICNKNNDAKCFEVTCSILLFSSFCDCVFIVVAQTEEGR